jgi:high-affinity Fe2+/Pb2+ permease
MKWSGQRMRNEWMEIFSQEGYRFCKVKPEETGVFYKYYEEGFHLVMFIDGTNGYLPTMTGLFLGIWENLVLLLLASVLAGIGSAVLLFFRKKKKKERIPFVPFVFTAYVLLLL